jgi:hypothetical protein
MDNEELKKFAQRAGEVLANFAIKNLKNLKPVDKAAQEFIESQKDLKFIEAKFNANSIEIIYNYLKRKYKEIEFPEKLDKMVMALKFYAEKNEIEKSNLIYKAITEELKKIEKEIIKIDNKYIPKFLV